MLEPVIPDGHTLQAQLTALRGELERVWCADTSFWPGDWSPEQPSIGQCAVTALIVHDRLGGDILRATNQGVVHYWNRLEGVDVDLTRDQFDSWAPEELPLRVTRDSLVSSGPTIAARHRRLLASLASEPSPPKASGTVAYCDGDTEPDAEFAWYTRALVSDVLPSWVSPLSWSLIAPAFEESNRRTLCDRLGVLERPRDNGYLFMGRFGGYAYLNLSANRAALVRATGTSASIDRVLAGDVSSQLPAVSIDRGLRYRVRARAGTTVAVARLPLMLWRARRSRREAVQRTDALLAGSPGPEALVEHLVWLRRLLTHTHDPEHLCRLVASGLIDQAVPASPAGPDVSALARFVGALPGLASAAPAAALTAIAAQYHESSATRGATEADMLLDEALREFVCRFGHRGVGEYDPLATVWAEEVDELRGVIRQLAEAPSPRAPPSRGSRDPRAVVTRRLMLATERAKSDHLVVVHQMRRCLRILTRLSLALAPADVPLVTVEELQAGGCSSDVLARRRDQYERRSAEPAFVLQNGQPVVPSKPHSMLVGVGASPGKASGRAFVATTPYDDIPGGAVLVTETTDTAWTPAFLTAAAVITCGGDALSHAAIVARELGIPAVVALPNATTRIRTGATVHVNGSTGAVRVDPDLHSRAENAE